MSLRPRQRGGAMPDRERWFSDDELREMSRPTMDRAIEALDRGDTDEARALCEAMKYEWRSLPDLMVEGVAGLISFVQERLGGDGGAGGGGHGPWRGGEGAGGNPAGEGPPAGGRAPAPPRGGAPPARAPP